MARLISREVPCQKKNKIVLAYSGGLDTSVICRWLQETYNAEVVTFTADIGQGEEVEPARGKSQSYGRERNLYRRYHRRLRRQLCFPNVPCQHRL